MSAGDRDEIVDEEAGFATAGFRAAEQNPACFLAVVRAGRGPARDFRLQAVHHRGMHVDPDASAGFLPMIVFGQ